MLTVIVFQISHANIKNEQKKSRKSPDIKTTLLHA